MASPQKENGFIPIATEVFEALCGIRISGEARQCLDVIIRKTYGFQKKEDKISLSQFCLLAKMPKQEVCRSLRKLAKMNLIIVKKANDNITLYRFNKDFDDWKPLAKKPKVINSLAKMPITIGKNAKASLAKMPHTIDTTTIDTLTIDNIAEQAPLEVIPDLLKDSQKHIQIIGLFARAKKIDFSDREQQRSFIRRNLRAAQNLKAYKPSRVAEVMKYLIDNAEFKWTLESVGKYIDDDLTKINNKSKIEII